MSIEWQTDITSKALLVNIYSYFALINNMTLGETDELLNKHYKYDTFVVLDGKGYSRYNIEGTVAYIIDCIVIDGGSNTLRKLCKLGREKFPYAKTIRYERSLKQRKNMRHFKLKDFIKEVL